MDKILINGLNSHEIPEKQLKIPCLGTIVRIDEYFLPAEQVVFAAEIKDINCDGMLLRMPIYFNGTIRLVIQFSLGKMPLRVLVDVVWQRRVKNFNYVSCCYHEETDIDTQVKIVQYLKKHADELVYS